MSEQLIQLDPAKVLADDNARFNLKRLQVESLAADILEQGSVLQPVEVEELKPHQNGFTHKLTSGFYRHAAVLKLNAEQSAGLTLPAIVRNLGDETTRLRHQISENVERESMSPMDQAVAADKLLKGGVTRPEVRRIFSRSTGKKSLTKQPLSNAMLNILLRFLELPKAIQEKIHDGRVGVEAAYELGKVPPEKRQLVLDRAEKERLAQIEREEKDEDRYLDAEKKMATAQEKEKEATSKVDGARTDITKAAAIVTEKKEALKAAQKAPYLELDEKGKRDAMESIKAATTDVKAAEKLHKDAQNGLAKLLTAAKTAAETAEEHRAKLESARKAVKSKGDKGRGKSASDPKIGAGQIKAAAKAEGVDTGYVALNASEMRSAIKEAQGCKEYPRVSAIAKCFRECFDGKTTPKEMIDDLAVVTGERPAPLKTAPASATPPAPAPAGAAKAVGAGATAAAKAAKAK